MRALDNNLLFRDKNDYYRGVFSIYEFNNSKPVSIEKRRKQRKRFKTDQARRGPTPPPPELGEGGPRPTIEEDKRDKLVFVEAFCLMPNHIHLLLKQIQEDGITKYMSKFGTGLGGYINRKHNRKGHVFQGRFLDVAINDDEHLKIIFTYIHTNSVALIEPKWKDLGIRDSERAIQFIENYKWSSYSDYLDKQNFPSVTDRAFVSEVAGGVGECRKHVNHWINKKEELRRFVSKVDADLIKAQKAQKAQNPSPPDQREGGPPSL